jgi:hypothetical protein
MRKYINSQNLVQIKMVQEAKNIFIQNFPPGDKIWRLKVALKIGCPKSKLISSNFLEITLKNSEIPWTEKFGTKVIIISSSENQKIMLVLIKLLFPKILRKTSDHGQPTTIRLNKFIPLFSIDF